MPSEPSAELVASICQRFADDVLKAILQAERDTANATWEAAAQIALSHHDHLGGTYSGQKIAAKILAARAAVDKSEN